MRIMLITPFYPPLPGGAAIYSSMITGYFRDQGNLEDLFVLTEHVRGLAIVERMGKVQVLRYLAPRDSRPILNSTARRLTSLCGLLQVVILSYRLKIDLIHWHNSAIIRAREIFSRQLKLRPVLLDVRDTLSPPERITGCNHYIASSGNTLNYLLRAGIPAHMVTYIPSPFTMPVVPGTVDIQRVWREYDLENGKGYFLFVGDLSEQKGVIELLEGFKLFRSSRTQESSLVLAGPDRTGGKLVSQIRKSEGVYYLGKVPRNDVLALMRGARCVVLPAKGEALPRVILEAIALGTPVICPPGVPEFAEHCPRFVLDEVSPPAIAAELTEVIERGKVASYPFDLHATQKTMEQLNEIYCLLEADICR